jgi:hypothetical protein
MSNQIANDKHVLYNDPDSMLKLYYYLDSKLSHFNRCYYLMFNKIKPLNKIKPKDKITIRYSQASFSFQVDDCGLSQPLVRWFNAQSRNKFFDKLFMIIDYYHKICLEIQQINQTYPKVFSSTTNMYDALGENIICILNILFVTYKSDFKSGSRINSFKDQIRKSKSLLNTFDLKNII